MLTSGKQFSMCGIEVDWPKIDAKLEPVSIDSARVETSKDYCLLFWDLCTETVSAQVMRSLYIDVGHCRRACLLLEEESEASYIEQFFEDLDLFDEICGIDEPWAEEMKTRSSLLDMPLVQLRLILEQHGKVCSPRID